MKRIPWVPWLELISSLSILALELWWLRRPGESHLPAYVARMAVMAIWWASWRRRRRQEGESPSYSSRAILETAIFTVLGVGLLALWGATVREPYDEIQFFFRELGLSDWPGWLLSRATQALTQQIGLQLFLWPVCREIFGRKRLAGTVAAAIFGLVHLPSPTLVLVTFVLAAFWISLYNRGAGLLVLTISHVILSSLGLALLPERVNYNMHVGRVALERVEGYRVLGTPEARRKLTTLCSEESQLRAEADSSEWIGEVFRVNLGRVPSLQETVAGQTLLEEGRSPCTVAKLFIAYPTAGRPKGAGDR